MFHHPIEMLIQWMKTKSFRDGPVGKQLMAAINKHCDVVHNTLTGEHEIMWKK